MSTINQQVYDLVYKEASKLTHEELKEDMKHVKSVIEYAKLQFQCEHEVKYASMLIDAHSSFKAIVACLMHKNIYKAMNRVKETKQ